METADALTRKRKKSLVSISEEERAIIHELIQYSLSPFLRMDEMNDREYKMMADFFLQEPKHSNVALSLLKKHLPKLRRREDYRELQRTIHKTARAFLFAMRKRELNGTQKFPRRALEIFNNPVWLALHLAHMDAFDLKESNRTIYHTICNHAILRIVENKCSNMVPSQILGILKQVVFMHPNLQKNVLELNDSDEFQTIFLPYFNMAMDINDSILYEAIIPALDYKLINWEEIEDNTWTLTLSESITHEIRKDIQVSIDIIVPSTLTLQRNESHELAFVGPSPWAKIARGGIWLGSVNKMRSLTTEEREKLNAEKDFEVTATFGYGLQWAMKLLGIYNKSFPLAHSTVWWYFRTLKDESQ